MLIWWNVWVLLAMPAIWLTWYFFLRNQIYSIFNIDVTRLGLLSFTSLASCPSMATAPGQVVFRGPTFDYRAACHFSREACHAE